MLLAGITDCCVKPANESCRWVAKRWKNSTLAMARVKSPLCDSLSYTTRVTWPLPLLYEAFWQHRHFWKAAAPYIPVRGQ